jgi:hypothetical protein
MEELPDLSRLSHEQKDELIRMLFPLIEKVRQLSVRRQERFLRIACFEEVRWKYCAPGRWNTIPECADPTAAE